VLSARPPQPRLVLPPDRRAWAAEQSEILVTALRDSKYHIVGDLSDLLSLPARGRYVAPARLPADQLLDAAVHAAAALADYQFLERRLVRRQPEPRGPRQKASKLEWTVLNGRWTQRVLRNASHIAAVRRLRVLIWCVLMHPTRHGLSPAPVGDLDTDIDP
jgi:hypothetical protein